MKNRTVEQSQTKALLLCIITYTFLSVVTIVVLIVNGYPPELYLGVPCIVLLPCIYFLYLCLAPKIEGSKYWSFNARMIILGIVYLVFFVLAAIWTMQDYDWVHDWPRQVNIARQWAETGDVEQQYILAELYDKKEQRANAFKWYSVAANNGHCKAQEKLAYFYRKGKWVEVDFGMAKYWEQMAVECYEKNDAR